MIVRMKKVFIFTQSKDAELTLERLRSLGILHIEYKDIPKEIDDKLKQNISLLKEAIDILSMKEFKASNTNLCIFDIYRTAEHIINCSKRIKYLEEYLLNLKSQIQELEGFGDFNIDSILKLREKNIFVKLYKIPSNEFKKLKGDFVLEKISSYKNIFYVAVISNKEVKLPFFEVNIPKLSLSKLKMRLIEDKVVINNLKEEIKKYSPLINVFKEKYNQLLRELEFYNTLNSMREVSKLKFISGFVPVDKVGLILKSKDKYNWGILIKEPEKDDLVPTLIVYPRFVKIIEPLFKFLELIPGYRELDISPIFLIFFIIFCGMLISDAGVGLVFILITLFLKINKTYKRLFYILSLSGIIFGLFSGTFFGQELFKIKPLVPKLASNLETFCFFIGAVHLTLAHLWKSIIKFPDFSFISDIGWGLIIWTGFFLANSLILGRPFLVFGKYFFILGSILVILGSFDKKNILKGFAIGIKEFLLNVVSSFTDVVSYIRLFAVGLASVAISDAFVKMAFYINIKNPIDFLIAGIIIIIGQVLNVLLGPLSILVHGVRLNVLEFCNHLGIRWEGIEYKPFK